MAHDIEEQRSGDIAVERWQEQRLDDNSGEFHSDAELDSATVNETKFSQTMIFVTVGKLTLASG